MPNHAPELPTIKGEPVNLDTIAHELVPLVKAILDNNTNEHHIDLLNGSHGHPINNVAGIVLLSNSMNESPHIQKERFLNSITTQAKRHGTAFIHVLIQEFNLELTPEELSNLTG